MTVTPSMTERPSCTSVRHRSGVGCVERRLDHAAPRRVERRRADQTVADHLERGDGVDALDDGGPLAGGAVHEVDVDAVPPERDVEERTSGRRFDSDTSGQAVGSGRSSNTTVVGGGVGAQLVPPDRAVVAALLGRHRVGIGVAGVREARSSRAATRRTRPGCSGARRRRSSPVATSITRRVLRSSPPSEVPTATSRPSRDGWYQSSAAVSSPWNRCGSSSRRGSAVGSPAASRTNSADWSSPPPRSTVNSRSPATRTPPTMRTPSSAASRSRSPARAGPARRARPGSARSAPSSTPAPRGRSRPRASGRGRAPRRRAARPPRRHVASPAPEGNAVLRRVRPCVSARRKRRGGRPGTVGGWSRPPGWTSSGSRPTGRHGCRWGCPRCPPEAWLWPDDQRHAELDERARLLAERHDEVFGASTGHRGRRGRGAGPRDRLAGPAVPGPRGAAGPGRRPPARGRRAARAGGPLPDGGARRRTAPGRRLPVLPVALAAARQARPTGPGGPRPRAPLRRASWPEGRPLPHPPAARRHRSAPQLVGPRLARPVLAAPTGAAIRHSPRTRCPTRLWLRSERQTLRRLPATGAVLFTIRVQQTPFASLRSGPTWRRRSRRGSGPSPTSW